MSFSPPPISRPALHARIDELDEDCLYVVDYLLDQLLTGAPLPGRRPPHAMRAPSHSAASRLPHPETPCYWNSPVTYFPGDGGILERPYVKGKAEGRAETRAAAEGRPATVAEVRAEAVLVALEQRQARLTPSQQSQVTSCADLSTLDRWLKWVYVVHDVDDLFAAESSYMSRVEGTIRSVLLVLDAQGIRLTRHEREALTSCTDLDTLTTWLTRAATATSTAEIFTEPESGA